MSDGEVATSVRDLLNDQVSASYEKELNRVLHTRRDQAAKTMDRLAFEVLSVCANFMLPDIEQEVRLGRVINIVTLKPGRQGIPLHLSTTVEKMRRIVGHADPILFDDRPPSFEEFQRRSIERAR